VGSEPMRDVIAACAMQSRSTTKSGKSWPMIVLIFDLRPFHRRFNNDSWAVMALEERAKCRLCCCQRLPSAP
jgi:hypothetical protein